MWRGEEFFGEDGIEKDAAGADLPFFLAAGDSREFEAEVFEGSFFLTEH